MEIRERVPTLVPERELIPQEGLPRLAAAVLPAALALFEWAFLFQEGRVRVLSPEFLMAEDRRVEGFPVADRARVLPEAIRVAIRALAGPNSEQVPALPAGSAYRHPQSTASVRPLLRDSTALQSKNHR